MDLLLGRTLGPYELSERLGAGGMGAVYRSTHQVLRQPRAIKVLPETLSFNAELVQRFRREATTAAGLRHTNIVQIYDVGEQDGLHYIVMELLEGRSLHQVIRDEGPLSVERAIRLLRQLADALDYAHARDIAHRDVKPANVIVGDGDHVTLVDFGIAHAASVTRITRTGMVVGTLEYMAPEALTGSGGGASADLYALGVVAYQLLAGRVPFRGDTPALMYAHVHSPPPPPRLFRTDLPEALETCLLRQLAKDPTERFPSAGAFVRALASAVLAGTAPSDSGRANGAQAGATSPPAAPAPIVGAPPETRETSPDLFHGRRTAPAATGKEGPHRLRRGASWLATAALVLVAVGVFAAYRAGTFSSTQVAAPTAIPAQPVGAATSVATAAPTAPVQPTAQPTPTASLPTPVPTTEPPPPASAPRQRLQAAREALGREEFAAALALLEALDRDAPTTPGLRDAQYEAHLGYGKQFLGRGLLDESYGQYGRALALRPGDPATLEGQKQVVLTKNWARMEAAWGTDDEAALAALEENMALDADFRETRQKLYALLIAKADRLLTAGERDAAFEVLMRALSVQPDGGEAQRRLVTYTPTPTPVPPTPTRVPVPQPQSKPQQVQPQPQSKPQQVQPQPQPAPPPPPPPAAPAPTKVLPGPSGTR